MSVNIYGGWGTDKGSFKRDFYVKGDLQDPGGQAYVKLRLPFASSEVLTLRQLSSWRKVTLPVSRTCQWTVGCKDSLAFVPHVNSSEISHTSI